MESFYRNHLSKTKTNDMFLQNLRIKIRMKMRQLNPFAKEQIQTMDNLDVEPLSCQIIKIAKQPFNFESTQILYLEDEYHPLINDYFQKNADRLDQIFNSKNEAKEKLEFVYIPLITKNKSQYFPHIKESFFYNFPYMTETDFDCFFESLGTSQTSFFTKVLLNSLGYNGDIYPGFIRARNKASENYTHVQLSYAKINCTNEADFEKFIGIYLDSVGDRRSDIFYSKSFPADFRASGKTDELADVSFNYEAHLLAEEIKEKIAQLSLKGYSQLLINSVAQIIQNSDGAMKGGIDPINIDLKSGIEHPRLSRLLINNEYKIFLPDYKNLEIEMTPLPKAVFFLFLRHPEGIIFKYLPDYKDELLQIYKQLSYRETPEEIIRSIEELVNPTKNSINEKCSRIKEAFVRHFEEHIARFYYITGTRGNQKSITIDRQLVVWDLDGRLKADLTLSKSQEEVKEIEKLQSEYYEKGLAYYGKNEFNTAIQYFSSVIELNPYHYRAFLHRAISWFNTGEYLKAIEDNCSAIDLNEMASHPFHNRAEVYLMTKEYDLALADIDYYIRNFGRDCSESYFLRGLIKKEMNDIQGACQDWFNADKLNHPLAKEYISRYPEIKIRTSIFDSVL